jgi:hypothetical protein
MNPERRPQRHWVVVLSFAHIPQASTARFNRLIVAGLNGRRNIVPSDEPGHSRPALAAALSGRGLRI